MKINEISKSYDITPHTLRYYEKIGLLYPKYSENGYRDYSYKDIQRLSIIRDLRFFDIPLGEIKKYLDTKNKKLTKDILNFESQQLNKRIKELKYNRSLLQDRINLIKYAEEKKNFEIQRIHYKDRYIVLSDKKNILDNDLHFELKQLHKQFESELHAINQNIFGTVLIPKAGSFKQQAFYCLTNKLQNEKTYLLPEGDYASIYYKGTYRNRFTALNQLKEYFKKNQIETSGHYFEFYLIGFHETNIPDEYVSKIEILIN